MLVGILKGADLAKNTKCDLLGKSVKLGEDDPEIAEAIQEAVFYSQSFDEEMSASLENILRIFDNLDNVLKKFVDTEIELLPNPLLAENRSFYDTHYDAENLHRWMGEVRKTRTEIEYRRKYVLNKDFFNLLNVSK